MVRFYFHGRVLGGADTLGITEVPTVCRSSLDQAPAAELSLEVTEGAIKVTVEVEAFTPDIANALFIPALDYARSTVAVLGLSDGVAYQAHLESVEWPDGTSRPVIIGDRKLAQRITAYASDDADKVLDMVLMEPLLAHVFNDAIMTLSLPHYGPISCGRMADTLARMIAPGLKPTKSWALLRQALNVDEAYIKLITDNAAPHRHGDRVAVSGELNSQIADRAFILLDRYLHYRLGSAAHLDPQAFPMLRGEGP